MTHQSLLQHPSYFDLTRKENMTSKFKSVFSAVDQIDGRLKSKHICTSRHSYTSQGLLTLPPRFRISICRQKLPIF